MALSSTRILHVVATLDPAAGGPPVIALSLAAAQAAAGHDVYMLSYEPPAGATAGIDGLLQSIPGHELLGRCVVRFRGRWARWTGRDCAELVQTLVPGVDLVHLHGVWEPLLRRTGLACERAGVPYAVLLNGMLDPWSLAQRKWKKKLAMVLGYRRLLDRAAFLHVGNEDERRLIEPLGLKSPSEIIPNGVFPNAFANPPPREAFVNAHPQLQDRPYVLFLSRLHFKKGLDYLADAFALVAAEHRTVHLIVAGPDGGERTVFEARVRELKIQDRVHVVGPLYGEQKLAALAGAACFCLPSRQEGFSMAILEALAWGTPVVISDACHFPLVAEVGAGDVVPLDPPAIASALTRILSDPSRRQSMSVAGQTLVAGRFSWPRIAEQVVEAYTRHNRGNRVDRSQQAANLPVG